MMPIATCILSNFGRFLDIFWMHGLAAQVFLSELHILLSELHILYRTARLDKLYFVSVKEISLRFALVFSA